MTLTSPTHTSLDASVLKSTHCHFSFRAFAFILFCFQSCFLRYSFFLHVVQVGLELLIHLPLPLEHRITGLCHHVLRDPCFAVLSHHNRSPPPPRVPFAPLSDNISQHSAAGRCVPAESSCPLMSSPLSRATSCSHSSLPSKPMLQPSTWCRHKILASRCCS